MVNPATYIRTRLLDHQPLTALIGDRLYPGWVIENKPTPYITYFRVGAPREASKDGTHVIEARYQLDIFSERYKDVDEIGEMIAGESGLLDEHIAPGVHIWIVDDNDNDEKEAGKFRRSIDCIARTN